MNISKIYDLFPGNQASYAVASRWHGHNVALAVGITTIMIACLFILKITARKIPPPPPLNGKLTHTSKDSETAKPKAQNAQLIQEPKQIIDDQLKNNAAYKNQIDQLQTRQKILDEGHQAEVNCLKSLKNQIEDLNEKNKKLEKDNQTLQQTINALTIEITSLRDSHQESSSLAFIDHSTQILQQQLEEVQTEHLQQLRGLESVIEQQKSEIDTIKQAYQEIEVFIQGIISYFTQLERPDKSLFELLMPLKQINGYSDHLKDFETRYQQVEVAYQEDMGQKEDQQALVAQLTAALKNIEIEKTQLETFQKLSQNKIEELNQTIESLSEQIKELEKKVEKSSANDKAQKDKISLLEKQIEELDKSLQETSIREDLLQTQLTNETDIKAQLSTTQSKEHEALEELKKELAQLKNQHASYEEFISQIQVLIASILQDQNVDNSLKEHIRAQLQRFQQVASSC